MPDLLMEKELFYENFKKDRIYPDIFDGDIFLLISIFINAQH